jgi:D-xylose transport system substrate-binding protein
MKMLQRRTAAVAVSAVAVAVLAAACGSSGSSSASNSSAGGSSSSGGGATSGKIALLLPENKTARYEAADRPDFTNKLKALCPNCQVLYSNAGQDSSVQQQQADAALTNGAKVLVLDPVDSEAAAQIVNEADQKGVKVVSYDRLINNSKPDVYISFDNEKVGELQGQALLDRLNALGTTSKGKVVFINGDPTDNNAGLFKAGAHKILDGKVTIGKEYNTAKYDPATAQSEMDQAITALGKSNIVGVYVANDGMAGGVITSLTNAGFNPLPPVTGQDSELSGVQRVIAGTQYMTIYKAIKPEAEQAAELAYDLLQGKSISSMATTTTNNKAADIPSILLQPVAVTKDKVESVIVGGGFYTAAQICTSQFAAACTAAGVK